MHLRALNTIGSFGLSLLLGLGLAGCGSSSEAEAQDIYVSEFTATVRSGPDKDLELHGVLVLGPASGSTVNGTLQTKDGDVTVAGALDGGLGLTFTLSDGRMVKGTDMAVTSVDTWPAKLEGGLTGPAADDTGDWLASKIVTGANGTTYETIFDGSGNVLKIIVTNSAGVQQTICNTSQGFSQNATC